MGSAVGKLQLHMVYRVKQSRSLHLLCCCNDFEQVVYPLVAELVEEHMRDHAVDEHDSLKLFSSDLENQKVEDEGFEDKMHQLMEVSRQHMHSAVAMPHPVGT